MIDIAPYPLVPVVGLPAGGPVPVRGIVHGLDSSYTHWACRCRACRQAHAIATRAYRLRNGRKSRRKLGRDVRVSGPRAELHESDSSERLKSWFRSPALNAGRVP